MGPIETVACNRTPSVCFALSQVFAPDAGVIGVLTEADIGPVSYGVLFGNDSVAPDGQFIRFTAIGTDNRNGYDIVRTSDGQAFAIVTFAEHAMARGLSHLKAHIRANPDHYSQAANPDSPPPKAKAPSRPAGPGF